MGTRLARSLPRERERPLLGLDVIVGRTLEMMGGGTARTKETKERRDSC